MNMGQMITNLLTKIDDIMYYPVLIIIMAVVGLYFTILTRGVQLRLSGTSIFFLTPVDFR